MLRTKKTNVLLWTGQGLLAVIFLFAGGMKLAMPLAELAKLSPLPAPFMEFIGVAEVLGAIGLVVPWLTRIQPGLTPLAASGLVIIMIGATVVTLAGGQVAPALIPAVVGFLAAFVADGRRQHADSTHDRATSDVEDDARNPRRLVGRETTCIARPPARSMSARTSESAAAFRP